MQADARRQRLLLGQGSDAPPIHMGPLLGYDDDGEPIMAPTPPPDFSEPPVSDCLPFDSYAMLCMLEVVCELFVM